MKTFLCIFIASFIIPHVSKAQKFETKKIEYIYALLKDNCELPKESGLFRCGEFNFPLRVEYNMENKICHLGISLFNEDYYNHLGKSMCNFHERLFLELYLLSDMDINNYCKEHKLHLSVIGLTGNKILAKKDIEQVIDLIKENNTKYILVKDSLYSSSTWQNKDKKAELFFPSTFSLISGMDKKEADDLFERELKNQYPIVSIPEALFVEKPDLHDRGKGIFVKYGKTIFIKEMTSNLYFINKEGEGYSILHDKKYPVESISNMIAYPNKSLNNLTINIKHKAYGGEIKHYNISFFYFLMFLYKDYNTYIGIEKASKNELSFTVIFQNKYYNCHHLLYVKTSPDTIFDSEGRLSGTLYTYIPNHNIKNLYKEYIEN